jgi:DNA-binding NarL/FixJ family response regulator
MIAAFVDDLLFRSKIRAVASHTGATVSFLRAPSDVSLAAAAMAIVDLDAPDAVATVTALRAAWPQLRVLGFVSHVHADRIREARAAGASEVMARSAFVNTLPDLLSARS